MPTIGNIPRPGYVYDTETDTWVPIGVGAHTHSDIPNTLVNAKGDIITATADNVPSILTVGNNGETLVADSSTATGLRYTAGTVQGNPVLNSAFQVFQRGTSVSIGASTIAYSADRWQVLTSANQATTVSRQATSDTTNLPSIQFCARFQRNSGQTGTSNYFFANSFETINSIAFAGKTVTVSFYARKGANYTAASDGLFVALNTATGTDENVFNYTGTVASPIGSTVTLTSTWQRFSVSATLSTSLTELAVFFRYTPVGTASTNDYFEVTGVQLDIGSVALPYRTYAATLAGELAACQRYCQNLANLWLAAVYIGGGINGNFSTELRFPVPMRTTPTATFKDSQSVSNKITTYTSAAAVNNVTATVNLASTGLTISTSGNSGYLIMNPYNMIVSAEL